MFRNRVTESDIRDWLDQNGFYGQSATFEEVELHAIQRPGWLQVFRFTVDVKTTEGQRVRLFGAVRDKETESSASSKTVVKAFDNLDSRSVQLDKWSDSLIVLAPNNSAKGQIVPIVCTLMIVTLFVGLFLLLRAVL